jgi:RimJ/RimL family protein N-acetyltransferase
MPPQSTVALPIVTARLVLREFETDDWYEVYGYASDPAVTRYMFFPPRTEQDSRVYVAAAIAAQGEQPRQTYELAVSLRDGGRLVGACDLTMEEEGGADVGYSLARDVWGQGYATELVHALVAVGFSALGLQRIVATVAPENHASARVLEKTGFRQMGVAHRYRYAKGRWWDMQRFALGRAEWRGDAEARS